MLRVGVGLRRCVSLRFVGFELLLLVGFCGALVRLGLSSLGRLIAWLLLLPVDLRGFGFCFCCFALLLLSFTLRLFGFRPFLLPHGQLGFPDGVALSASD